MTSPVSFYNDIVQVLCFFIYMIIITLRKFLFILKFISWITSTIRIVATFTMLLCIFSFVEIRQRMNGRKRLNVLTTKTIPIKTFPEYYEKLQETPHILKIEFNELNEISAKYNMSDNVAKRYDNYKKNRYVNIVPCKFLVIPF